MKFAKNIIYFRLRIVLAYVMDVGFVQTNPFLIMPNSRKNIPNIGTNYVYYQERVTRFQLDLDLIYLLHKPKKQILEIKNQVNMFDLLEDKQNEKLF